MALSREAGATRFVWDLRREPFVKTTRNMRYSNQTPERVIPGDYQVKLTVGDTSVTQALTVLPDPNRPVSDEAYRELADILAQIRVRMNEIGATVNQLDALKKQANGRSTLAPKGPGGADVKKAVKDFVASLEAWEDHVRQPPVSEGRRDTVNYPTRLLTTQYAALKSNVDDADPPASDGAKLRLSDLNNMWQALQDEWVGVTGNGVTALNTALEAADLPPIMVPALED